jgi:hypothetical protein
VTAAGHADVGLERPRHRISPVTVAIFAGLLVAGIGEGAAAYASRSPKVERHVAGTNAIPIHVLIAAASAAVVITIQLQRSRQPASQRRPSPWIAPFSGRAASRLRRTVRLARGISGSSLARATGAGLLVLVILDTPFRMGQQIIGGLDPNATVNAWGGPTYLGALIAHYLDGIVIFYAAAYLLNRLLLPDAENR